MKHSSLSIIIPCYKSTENLDILVHNLIREFRDETIEIILVCDGSPDTTWNRILELSKNSNLVKCLNLGRNVGQNKATLTGCEYAKNELIATIDDDGQHDASSLKVMYDNFNDQLDVIYGKSELDEHGKIRIALSKFVKWFMSKVLNVQNANKISPLRIFRRDLIEPKVLREYVGKIDLLLIRSTKNISVFEIQMKRRKIGKSNYSTVKLLKHGIDLIFSSSENAVFIVIFMGLIGSLFSFVALIITFLQYIMGYIKVSGYTSIILLMTFGFSVILAILGIMGKYLFSLTEKSNTHNYVWIREKQGF